MWLEPDERQRQHRDDIVAALKFVATICFMGAFMALVVFWCMVLG